jgi:osmoprotectant transport system ATP-binding protein
MTIHGVSESMNTASAITIEFLDVHYQSDAGNSVLGGLSFVVNAGEIFMLLGRSGSGKTTSLKMINRLLTPSKGEVRVHGVPTTQWDPVPLRRYIGYAIQEIGLFPHYTIAQNVGLIPKLEGWTRTRVQTRIAEVLTLVGLPPQEFANRYPEQLSGGQKQRAGLARALAADPPILLMDEPFGALDPITRAELQREFRRLQQRLSKTVIFVTHDVAEALLLGNRIALLDAGTLRGIYTPQEFLNGADEYIHSYLDPFRAGWQLLQSEL